MPKSRKRWTSWLKKKQGIHLFLPFVLFGSSVDWLMPTHISGGGTLLSLQNQMLISSKTSSEMDPEITFYQLSGHPLT